MQTLVTGHYCKGMGLNQACVMIWLAKCNRVKAADKTIIEPLQILQNKLLRVLTKKGHMYSTNKVHNDLDLLKINDIYESEVLSFVYNCVNKNVPKALGSYFTMMGNTHNFNTRNLKKYFT